MDNPQSTMFKVEQLLKNEQCDIRIVKNGNEYAFNFPQNRVYTIPAYQREIRWKKENIRLLINDINNGPKFLGTILLSTKDNLHFSVIDGQQRITMLILVISYIKKEAGNNIIFALQLSK
ncbi:MAG: DUF262 domain-containing protein [Eubacteriales bacterium]|nr:DUF262 domain-containing protein [Eubacteriales bacterium]